MSIECWLRPIRGSYAARALFVWLAVCASPFTCAAQAAPPACFAFLTRGNVTIDCEGQTTQITRRGDIEQFAVSDEKITLGFVTSKIVKKTATEADTVYTTTLADLGSGRLTEITGQNALVSTCGGIFWLYDASRQRLGRFDLTSGAEVMMPPNSWFRCSDDRNVVVGTSSKSGTDLLETAPTNAKIAREGSFNFYQFNVSAKGRNIVYTAAGRPLCVFEFPGPSKCTDLENGTPDVPSVNEAGEVLVSVQTDEECFYKSPSDFTATRIPGAGRDACLGIGYWKPTMRSVTVIEPLGRNPQWISPATAALLRNWSARVSR